MKCYIHPDVDAVGTCTNCGKFVCSSCAVDLNGKVVCKSCVEKMSGARAGAAPGSAPIATNSVAGGPAAGAPVAPAPVRKEPILSLILSFIIPGVGQIYNGQVKKGIAFVVGYIALWVIAFGIYFIVGGLGSLVTFGMSMCCCAPIFVVPLIFVLYAMYDAYVSAKKFNDGVPLKDWLS